jgi:hypothetical protein
MPVCALGAATVSTQGNSKTEVDEIASVVALVLKKNSPIQHHWRLLFHWPRLVRPDTIGLFTG